MNNLPSKYKNSIKNIFVAALTASALLDTASAVNTEYNKNVAKLGAQNANFYVQFVEPFSQDCIWNLAYFSEKNIYAQLLSALISEKKVSRIDYTQPNGTGTECVINLVELAK